VINLKPRNTLDWVAWVLVVVGALNWGLTVLGFNLVEVLLGWMPVLVTVVYALVGLAALYMVYAAFAGNKE
jgi:uncharacterized membrane protein YuzA (DUF378 family)